MGPWFSGASTRGVKARHFPLIAKSPADLLDVLCADLLFGGRQTRSFCPILGCVVAERENLLVVIQEFGSSHIAFLQPIFSG